MTADVLVWLLLCYVVPLRCYVGLPKNYIRCVCLSLHWCSSGTGRFQVESMCVLTPAACVARLWSVTPPVIRSTSAANTQGFYFCRKPKHNTAVQHRTDHRGWEDNHRNKIKHLVCCQNEKKKLCLYGLLYFTVFHQREQHFPLFT